MAISGEAYKRIGRTTAGAVAIVTALQHGGSGIVGLTVSSFVTLSFDPPLVMFAIQRNANSYPSILSSKCFGVSLLGADQADVARRFAVKGVDKFINVEFETGRMLPVALIRNSLAQIECTTSEIFSSGDHAIVVGLVEEALAREGEPLLYFSQRFGTFVSLPED